MITIKNIIIYNYDLPVEKVIKINDYVYTFYIDYNKYYFLKLIRPENDIEDILSLIKKIQSCYHEIILTKETKFFTTIKGDKYILLKLKYPENNEIILKDIINLQIPTFSYNGKLKRTNWALLWEQKNDYLEYQMSELAKDHESAIKSFSYYIGLSENAIFYFNQIKGDIGCFLTQKRIKYPNISLNFFNPINLVVDYRVRDIAEYLKSKFWEEENPINELDELIEMNILTQVEYNYLFCRMLYPSNYFDDLGKVLEKNISDDILIKYIERANDYQNFLRDSFIHISKKANIIKIDWLIKEH